MSGLAREPCALCGEETASGSWLHAARHRASSLDGDRYLCADCLDRTRPERRAELSEQEVARLEMIGSAFGIWFSPTSH